MSLDAGINCELPHRARASDVDPDAGVVDRAAAGDASSFGVLVKRHEQRVMRVCFRMLGDREDAREASQEIFLKAYRGLSRFKPGARFYTWLYRIAVNHCLNQLRRRKVVKMLTFSDLGSDDEPEAGLDPPDLSPDAFDRLQAERRWRTTRRWIDALPINQRAVLVLAKFEGLSYRDIAQTLNISESAVESRLFRAMRRLSSARDAASTSE